MMPMTTWPAPIEKVRYALIATAIWTPSSVARKADLVSGRSSTFTRKPWTAAIWPMTLGLFIAATPAPDRSCPQGPTLGFAFRSAEAEENPPATEHQA